MTPPAPGNADEQHNTTAHVFCENIVSQTFALLIVFAFAEMSEPPNRTGRWERYLGPNPPPSSYIPRYRDLDTDQPIEDTKMIKFAEEIKSVLGKSLYLWQAHAIQKLLTGRDLLVKASTGAGKSLPYQAMALSRPGAVVLVVSPLIGLINNQVDTILIILLISQGQNTLPPFRCAPICRPHVGDHRSRSRCMETSRSRGISNCLRHRTSHLG